MELNASVYLIRMAYRNGDTVHYRDVSLTLSEIRAAARRAGHKLILDADSQSRPDGEVETIGPRCMVSKGPAFLRIERPEWLAPAEADFRLHSMAEKLARSEARAEGTIDRAREAAASMGGPAEVWGNSAASWLKDRFEFQADPIFDEAPFRLLCRRYGLKVWVHGRSFLTGDRAMAPMVDGAPYAIVARRLPDRSDPVSCGEVLAFPLHPNQAVYPEAILARFDGRGGYKPYESLVDARLGDKGPEDFPLREVPFT